MGVANCLVVHSQTGVNDCHCPSASHTLSSQGKNDVEPGIESSIEGVCARDHRYPHVVRRPA